EDIVRRVSGRHDDRSARHLGPVGQDDPAQFPALSPKIVDACREEDVDSHRGQRLPPSPDDLWESVRADMRPGIHEDVGRSPVVDQELEHLAHAPPLVCPGVELAIAEGAGPTLAETVVRLRIELAPLRERVEIVTPIPDDLSSLEHDGPNA